jgi:alpha-glucoside transport system substrate-binding protein
LAYSIGNRCKVDPSLQNTPNKTLTSTVSILTAFNTNEAQTFKKTLAAFERDTGTIVNIIPADAEFANVVSVASQGLKTPDLGLFPQPSVLKSLIRDNSIKPLSPEVQNIVRQNFPNALNQTVTYKGNIYSVWIQTALKSLVWYRRDILPVGATNRRKLGRNWKLSAVG